MKRDIIFLAVALFFSFQLYASQSKGGGSIEYKVAMPQPHTHYFEVEIILKNYSGDFVDFKMPVWTPGSYLVREYAKNVEGFSASAGKEDLPIGFNKTNKNTWRVSHNSNNLVTINYRVYANDGSIRMSYLDDGHAFIMANTLLMFVEQLRETSSVLKIDLPDQWKKISTTLSKLEGKEHAFYVPNYDILVDSPIEIGNHETLEFVAAGIPHEVVMSGKANYNAQQIKQDLTKIVETTTAIFGENPNEKYIFFVHNADKGAGGLEHLNSTVLGVSRWAYTSQTGYNRFLSLAAHEYFHLWMVKRLKPKELESIDYNEEVYTRLLWLMEGVTSYYDEKIMHQAGFHDDKTFLGNLLDAMADIKNTPGANEQSLAEASFDAWIKYYRRDENSDNSQISYYTKGAIVGALLDLKIISSSNGLHSLDDVVSQIYHQFYKKKGQGIDAEDFKNAAEKAAGCNLDQFFEDYIYGTKDLDNAGYLKSAGILLVDLNESTNEKSIGIRYRKEASGLFVSYVMKNSSSYDNGINVGDELIAVNGFRINEDNLDALINQYKIGERVNFLIHRDGLMHSIDLDIRKNTLVDYTYEMEANPGKQQVKVYKTWMGQ